MKNEPPTEHNIKNQALLRDGFKCTVTGLYDYDTCLLMEANERGDKRTCTTQAAYLFPAAVVDVPKVSTAARKITTAPLSNMCHTAIFRVCLRSADHVRPCISSGIALQRRF